MKILLINLWPVIDSKGGTEKVFFDMANAFASKGHNVVALACDNKLGNPFFPVSDKVKFINVGIGYQPKFTLWQRVWGKICGNKNARHCFRERIVDVQQAKLLVPVIEKEQPDIIVSYNVGATRLLKNHLSKSIPIITMFHFNPEHILDNCTTDTKEALKECDCIQVLLPSFIDKTKQYINNDNIVCISNCVPQYNDTCGGEKRNVIINVGRIDSFQKRQDLLIKAFSKIAPKYPSWSVEFWGEIEKGNEKYYTYCNKLIADANLENRIKFCGTSDKIKEKLLQAKIFAFPSRFEGFGIALAEGMSLGLPAVAFQNCPAVNELIETGKTGILCADGIKPLAEALEVLINDDNIRAVMGKAAQKSMEEYAPENIWWEWEILMMKVVKKHKEGKYV